MFDDQDITSIMSDDTGEEVLEEEGEEKLNLNEEEEVDPYGEVTDETEESLSMATMMNPYENEEYIF
jgi:hypothetical protein